MERLRLFARYGVLALALTMLGCNVSRPSADAAKKVLQQKLGGSYEVLEFKKTDGNAMEIFGVKGYSLSYESRVRYNGMPSHSVRDIQEASEAFDFLRRIGAWNFKKGDVLTISGSVSFKKTENGWEGWIY